MGRKKRALFNDELSGCATHPAHEQVALRAEVRADSGPCTHCTRGPFPDSMLSESGCAEVFAGVLAPVMMGRAF